MKRKFLVPGILAVCAFFMPSESRCAGPINPAYTYSVAVSSGGTYIISVATFGATQVDTPQIANRAAIEIQNIDSSANLWCVIVSSSTPTALSVGNGRLISALASWELALQDTFYMPSYSASTGLTTILTLAKVWCVSSGAAATKAAVTQIY